MSQRFDIIQPAQLVWRDDQPFSPLYDDIYFSRGSGLAETEHVFINANQLPARWKKLSPHACFTIAESGFGTGLNFLVTWHHWLQHAPSQSKLFYYTTESHPLTRDDLSQCLSLWPDLNYYAQQLLTVYPILTPGFHKLSFESGRVNLILMLGDVVDCYEQLIESTDCLHVKDWRDWSVDAWFLDGFAPVKNSKMWCDEFFRLMTLLSHSGTTFSSYTASGSVRHQLTTHGFEVRLTQGFGEKRHMIQGTFSGAYDFHSKNRQTPWHVVKDLRSPCPTTGGTKKILVIGGGLSGCFMAHALAKRGYHVQLLEKNAQVAQGGSANRHAILYPKLSAFSAPFTHFMLQAFLYAQAFYQPLVGNAFDGSLNGILQFAVNARDKKAQVHLKDMLSWYPELARFVSRNEASSLAGVRILEEALYIPHAGWINVPQLCEYLVHHPLIEVLCNTHVHDLNYSDNLWQAAGQKAPIVVLANAMQMLEFSQTQHLLMKPVQGGLTFLEHTDALQYLKISLCADGHLMPLIDGVHVVGATYHHQANRVSNIEAEHQKNCLKAQKMPLDVLPDLKVRDYWSDVRVATVDYLPLAGGVAIPELFAKKYALLKKNARHYVPDIPESFPGLFVCTGFGSRGLCSIPLTSEYLAGLINREPVFLQRTIRQAISPQRFLLKNLVRV